MHYLNTPLSVTRGPEYRGSSPAERGTWFSLSAYCADQENGGRIVGGALWKDRQWQQVCGVTMREIRAASRLVTFEGDDVIVFGYPVEQEAKIQAKRNAGKAGGAVRTEAKSQAARANGASGGRPITQAETQANADDEPKQEPNERERKGMKEPQSPSELGEGWGREGNADEAPGPTHEELRLSALFNRRPTTTWSAKEIKAFKAAKPTMQDIEAVEEYYHEERQKQKGFHRRDLLTLLNNWSGEVDRAIEANRQLALGLLARQPRRRTL